MEDPLVFNRASDNYLFHGSHFKAGNTRDFLRLSTANNEAVIDLCNNSNIDISATDVFINGNRVVTSSGISGSTFGSLEVTGTTVLQDLSAGATDISSTLGVAGAVTLDTTLYVAGATTVSTFESTGATSLAKDGGVVNIAKSGVMTTVKGTLNVDEAVTLDSTLDVTGDTSVYTFDSSGATSLATGGGVVNIAKSGVMTTVKGNLNVDEAVTLDSTLVVAGATTVYTFESTGATSLAKDGGVVDIAKSGVMTTVKGTLNVNEAVTLDSTLDVTGDTSVYTFDSSGATSLATGGGVVNIAKSGVMTTVKGNLNVDEAVTLDSTLVVAGATTVYTFESTGATSLAKDGGVVDIAKSGVMTTVKGTLNVNEAVTLDSTLQIGSGLKGGQIYSTTTDHELVIDPFGLDTNSESLQDASGVVTILGDLIVKGNTTTFHSINVDISNHLLKIASNSTTAGQTNNAGIQIGDGYATFTYNSFGLGNWSSNIGLDVAGDTSVSTFDSTGATSLATGGGEVNIAKSGVMTTVKGTLNVDEAVTLDSTLVVAGATTVSTFESTGATSLAKDGGVVNIAKSGVMTTVKGTLNVDEAVTLDNTLTIAGNLKTSNNLAQIPVTFSTFEREIGNSIQTQDLSALGGIDTTTYQDASGWSVTRTVLSGYSYIKMEFKANFISSPEFDQTLSFRVLRSLNGGGFDENNPVFEDTEIGSNMGVTIRGVYNGTYIDYLAGGLAAGQSVAYKLQFKRNKASGDTIQTAFGIVPGGNYIFLQELYQPNA